MTYGLDTHSYLKSSEHAASKKERHEFTVWYLSQPHPLIEIDWGMCRCSEFDFPHPPHYEELRKFEGDRSLR